MANKNVETDAGRDSLELDSASRPFDLSATAWLVGQAVTQLNTAGKEGEYLYGHTTKLLHDCEDAKETIIRLFLQTTQDDAPLRWSLLYVLGDVADSSAADFLVDLATTQLPENQSQCCEGPQDSELLVRTMAVQALATIANRDGGAADHVIKLIKRQPAQPILIEATKAAIALNRRKEIVEILPKEAHWILDIRHVHCNEVQADPERADTGERSFTPPNQAKLATAPSAIYLTK